MTCLDCKRLRFHLSEDAGYGEEAGKKQAAEALRAHGWSVQSLATVGDGCPDLAVGVRGLTLLLEVKDGNKPPSARKLTPDETTWHQGWRGHVAVVESVQEAVELCRQAEEAVLSWRYCPRCQAQLLPANECDCGRRKPPTQQWCDRCIVEMHSSRGPNE